MSKLYDEVTGQLTAEAVQDAQAQAQDEVLAEAAEVESMRAHPGWKRLEKWLVDTIESLKEALVDEEDPKKIVQYQQSVRAYSNVIGQVHSLAEQARLIKEEKNEGKE